MATPIVVPFDSTTPNPVPIHFNFDFFFEASRASGDVIVESADMACFSQPFGRIVVKKGLKSPVFKAVKSDADCPLSTWYENGQASDAVTRPIHISKDGQHFPIASLPTTPSGFSWRGVTVVLLLLAICGFVAWRIWKRRLTKRAILPSVETVQKPV